MRSQRAARVPVVFLASCLEIHWTGNGGGGGCSVCARHRRSLQNSGRRAFLTILAQTPRTPFTTVTGEPSSITSLLLGLEGCSREWRGPGHSHRARARKRSTLSTSAPRRSPAVSSGRTLVCEHTQARVLGLQLPWRAGQQAKDSLRARSDPRFAAPPPPSSHRAQSPAPTFVFIAKESSISTTTIGSSSTAQPRRQQQQQP